MKAANLIAGTVLIAGTRGHGFMLSPNQENKDLSRGIAANIATSIDSIRNPNTAGTLCRGEAPGIVTPISLQNGSPHVATLAFSIGAAHVGPCSMQILDADNMQAPGIEIGSQANCARTGPIHDDKSLTSRLACTAGVPANLVTNDMCNLQWSFIVKNADQIKCKNCVMRFVWTAQHVSPSENYETCADVSLGNSPAKNPAPAALKTLAQSKVQGSPVVSNQSSTAPSTSTPSAQSKSSLKKILPKVKAATKSMSATKPMTATKSMAASGGMANVGDSCNGSAVVCVPGGVAQCNFGTIVSLGPCPGGLVCNPKIAVCDWPPTLNKRNVFRSQLRARG